MCLILLIFSVLRFRIILQHTVDQESAEELQEVVQGALHCMLAKEVHELVPASSGSSESVKFHSACWNAGRRLFSGG